MRGRRCKRRGWQGGQEAGRRARKEPSGRRETAWGDGPDGRQRRRRLRRISEKWPDGSKETLAIAFLLHLLRLQRAAVAGCAACTIIDRSPWYRLTSMWRTCRGGETAI